MSARGRTFPNSRHSTHLFRGDNVQEASPVPLLGWSKDDTMKFIVKVYWLVNKIGFTVYSTEDETFSLS